MSQQLILSSLLCTAALSWLCATSSSGLLFAVAA